MQHSQLLFNAKFSTKTPSPSQSIQNQLQKDEIHSVFIGPGLANFSQISPNARDVFEFALGKKPFKTYERLSEAWDEALSHKIEFGESLNHVQSQDTPLQLNYDHENWAERYDSKMKDPESGLPIFSSTDQYDDQTKLSLTIKKFRHRSKAKNAPLITIVERSGSKSTNPDSDVELPTILGMQYGDTLHKMKLFMEFSENVDIPSTKKTNKKATVNETEASSHVDDLAETEVKTIIKTDEENTSPIIQETNNDTESILPINTSGVVGFDLKIGDSEKPNREIGLRRFIRYDLVDQQGEEKIEPLEDVRLLYSVWDRLNQDQSTDDPNAGKMAMVTLISKNGKNQKTRTLKDQEAKDFLTKYFKLPYDGLALIKNRYGQELGLSDV